MIRYPIGVFFFFSSRRRHTRWNCDWSSDVCSSDLVIVAMVEPDEVSIALARNRADAALRRDSIRTIYSIVAAIILWRRRQRRAEQQRQAAGTDNSC